jgi:hypothetical protein
MKSPRLLDAELPGAFFLDMDDAVGKQGIKRAAKKRPVSSAEIPKSDAAGPEGRFILQRLYRGTNPRPTAPSGFSATYEVAPFQSRDFYRGALR